MEWVPGAKTLASYAKSGLSIMVKNFTLCKWPKQDVLLLLLLLFFFCFFFCCFSPGHEKDMVGEEESKTLEQYKFFPKR